MTSLAALIIFGLMLAVCVIALGKSNSGAKKINASGSPGRRHDGTGSDRSQDHPILQVNEARPHTSM